MKKIISLIAAAAIFAGAVSAQVSGDIAEKCYKILETYEKNMAYHGDYSLTATFIIEKPGKPKENIQYKWFERTDQKTFTAVQIFPEADKGKGYLRNGDNFWSYDPISRKFSHASVKDTIGDSDMSFDDNEHQEGRWRTDYDIAAYEEGTLGKVAVDIITLKAKTREPKYVKTKLYMRKDVPLVLKVEDFSGSDRLMRTTLIPKYSKLPHGYISTQLISRDELNKGEQTQEILSDFTFEPLPDKIFTKAYLESLN